MHRFLKIASLCLCFITLACAKKGQYALTIQSSVQPELATELETARTSFNEEAGLDIIKTKQDGYPISVGFGPLQPTSVGHAEISSSNCKITLSEKFTKDPSQKNLMISVFYHELGHCILGPSHTEEKNQLMSVVTLPIQSYNEEALNSFFNTIRNAAAIH